LVPGQDETVTMRERYGEDSSVVDYLATRLYHTDPDTLGALIDDLQNTTAGYEMEALLPGIRCPVLLLQADPDAGGLMKDAEVKWALPQLVRGRRVRLEGIGHALFCPRKGPALRAIAGFCDSVAAFDATGHQQVEEVLCGAIGAFETAFPGRIRGYYMTGSYHDGDAVPESDLDVIAVFGGEFEPGEETAGLALNAYCSRFSPIRLDVQPRCEAQVFENGDRDLKLDSWLLHGADIRDAIEIRPLPDPVFAIRSLIWNPIQPLRGWPDVLVYPLAYPDPDDAFYGYARLGIRLPNGDHAPGTRSLISTVTMAAMVLVNLREPCYIGSKRQAIEMYEAHVGDRWTSWMQELYADCRMRWHYRLPRDPAGRARLRDLCARALGFENHVLDVCRTHLLEKLCDEDPQHVLAAAHCLWEILFLDDEVETALRSLVARGCDEVRRVTCECLERMRRARGQKEG
jgi:hypothetical protein